MRIKYYTIGIYNFVRGHLSWEESLKLLYKIVESKERMSHLVTYMLLYQMGLNKQEPKNNNRKSFFKTPINPHLI